MPGGSCGGEGRDLQKILEGEHNRSWEEELHVCTCMCVWGGGERGVGGVEEKPPPLLR